MVSQITISKAHFKHVQATAANYLALTSNDKITYAKKHRGVKLTMTKFGELNNIPKQTLSAAIKKQKLKSLNSSRGHGKPTLFQSQKSVYCRHIYYLRQSMVRL